MEIPKVTPEFCEGVVGAYVTPLFEASCANGLFGRRDGSLIIATLPENPLGTDGFDGPNADFREAAVVYEHSWGRTQVDGTDFSFKAVQKVFGAWKLRKDYERVLVEDPEFVEEHDLIKFPGAVIMDVTPAMLNGTRDLPLMVAGYAGLWWWHDVMIANQTLSGLKAELTRQVHEPE